MAEVNNWILTDIDAGVYVDQIDLAPGEHGAPASTGRWSIRKRRMHGGLADGVDIIHVDNGELSFSVLPTRGMGIWRGSYRGLFLGWYSPVAGPVNPAYVNLADRAGLGWLQGFDEMIVRCGLDSNGAPCIDSVMDNNGNLREMALPLHGRIANSPARRVAVVFEPGCQGRADRIVVSGVVEEALLFGPRLQLASRICTEVGSNRLIIVDEVSNLRAVDAEMQMLYHCNFGPPFLDAGASLLAPAVRAAPRDARAAEDPADSPYLSPTAGYIEQAYYYAMASGCDCLTTAALVNSSGDKAIAIRYDVRSLPAFTQWKNTAAESDGYVTGLEPGTNYPNAKPFERANGRVVLLPPGGKWRAQLEFEVVDSAAAVQRLRDEISDMADVGEPKILSRPQPGWSPNC